MDGKANATLCNSSLSVEQEEDNTQSDQADNPVFAQSTKQRGQIGYNTAEEEHLCAKEDFDSDPKGDQQQSNLSDLAKPSFC
ncbi:MAG: hypothetical protein ACYS9T_10285, partial [Planctomycetota bacterium]